MTTRSVWATTHQPSSKNRNSNFDCLSIRSRLGLVLTWRKMNYPLPAINRPRQVLEYRILPRWILTGIRRPNGTRLPRVLYVLWLRHLGLRISHPLRAGGRSTQLSGSFSMDMKSSWIRPRRRNRHSGCKNGLWALYQTHPLLNSYIIAQAPLDSRTTQQWCSQQQGRRKSLKEHILRPQLHLWPMMTYPKKFFPK